MFQVSNMLSQLRFGKWFQLLLVKYNFFRISLYSMKKLKSCYTVKNFFPDKEESAQIKELLHKKWDDYMYMKFFDMLKAYDHRMESFMNKEIH